MFSWLSCIIYDDNWMDVKNIIPEETDNIKDISILEVKVILKLFMKIT